MQGKGWFEGGGGKCTAYLMAAGALEGSLARAVRYRRSAAAYCQDRRHRTLSHTQTSTNPHAHALTSTRSHAHTRKKTHHTTPNTNTNTHTNIACDRKRRNSRLRQALCGVKGRV
eukprot:3732959-Rhodomonas_salina.1